MIKKIKKIGVAIISFSMAFCMMPQAYGSGIASIVTTETEFPEVQENITVNNSDEKITETTTTSDTKEQNNDSLGGGGTS